VAKSFGNSIFCSQFLLVGIFIAVSGCHKSSGIVSLIIVLWFPWWRLGTLYMTSLGTSCPVSLIMISSTLNGHQLGGNDSTIVDVNSSSSFGLGGVGQIHLDLPSQASTYASGAMSFLKITTSLWQYLLWHVRQTAYG